MSAPSVRLLLLALLSLAAAAVPQGEALAGDGRWLRRAAPPAPATEDEKLYREALVTYAGLTRPPDDERALSLFRRAADAGHPLAPGWVGWMTWQGRGTPKKEADGLKLVEKALPAVRKRAGQGDADAQLLLGGCLLHGVGVEKDEKQAVKWYHKAADQDNVSAWYNLGMVYRTGKGVEKDERRAFEWNVKAAEKGHAGAMNNLGVAYHNGHGVEQDQKKGVEWFRKAADKGLAHAMYNLGNAYNSGRGVKRDRLEAQKWYKKAADLGHPEAKKKAR
jgi:hypothetical protein